MRTRLIVLTLTLGAIACTDRTAPTSGPLVSPSLTGSIPEQTDYPGERPYKKLAQVAPSLGGLYFDRLTGDLNVYLKDLSEGPAAKRALPLIFGQALSRARARHPNAGIVFKQGTYTFMELARWRDTLNDFFFDTPSVQWWAIAHSKNQIVVGVLSLPDSEAIVTRALELGVPAGALRFQRSTGFRPDFRPDTTIVDSIRPIQGGTLIQHMGPNGINDCTLGFLALWGGQHAFVTAAHCGIQEMSLDSGFQFQPHLNENSASIGFEVADNYETCGRFLKCSWADASVYQATLPPGDWYFKRVAKTVWGCFQTCTPHAPLTIDSTQRFWSIVRTDSVLAENELVNKIGIATGWSEAFVFSHCANIKTTFTSLQCQGLADYQSDFGDSGAPVLMNILGGGDTTVTLGGIHSGRLDSVYAVFSTWAGIIRMYPGLRVY